MFHNRWGRFGEGNYMTLGYRIRHRFEHLMHLFGEDLSYFAASLSFYTIFSIIPMLWVLFFILSQDAVFAEYYLAWS